MKKISYIKLYDYYTKKENLSFSATLRNIWRVRNLPGKYKNLISEILKEEGSIPDFSCEGISLNQLVNEENMQPVNAVLFLDWVRREPIEAVRFMHTGRIRASVQELTDDECKKMSEALKNLRTKTCSNSKWNPDPQDNSKEDIDIEDDEPVIENISTDKGTGPDNIGYTVSSDRGGCSE